MKITKASPHEGWFLVIFLNILARYGYTLKLFAFFVITSPVILRTDPYLLRDARIGHTVYSFHG
jgi:hypothetical protein